MDLDTSSFALYLILAVGCIPGAAAQTENNMTLWIIVSVVAAVVLIVCIIILYCIVCKPKSKKTPEPLHGSLKYRHSRSSGSGRLEPSSVWTTENSLKRNNSHYVQNGKPPGEFKILNGAPGGQRIFVSTPELSQPNPAVVPITRVHSAKAHPVARVPSNRNNHVVRVPSNRPNGMVRVPSSNLSAGKTPHNRKDSKKAQRKSMGEDSKGITLNDEEQIQTVSGGNKIRISNAGQPTARVYVSYDSPPPSYSSGSAPQSGDQYVAKVYSDYSDPKDIIHGPTNVSRVYSHGREYDASSRNSRSSTLQKNPSTGGGHTVFVAQSLVRSHESALNSAGANQHAINIHRQARDMEVTRQNSSSTGQRPVIRTQSNIERSKSNSKEKQPKQKKSFFGRSKTSKTNSNESVSAVERSPPIVRAAYSRDQVVNRSPSDTSSLLRGQPSGQDRPYKLVAKRGAQLTKPERPHSQQVAAEVLITPDMQRSNGDTSVMQSSYPTPEELYAVPLKIKKSDSPPRARQRPPSTPTSPEPPPVPNKHEHNTPQPDTRQTTLDENENQISKPGDAISIATSDAGSIGKADLIASQAFSFLDDFDDDHGDVQL